MSVVLQFPINRVSSRDEFELAHCGEVVIFPGVRVERCSFEGSKPAVRSQKRRATQAAIDEDMA